LDFFKEVILFFSVDYVLTCENCRHQCREHEEQHAEEQTACVVKHLSRLVTNA